MDKRPDQAAGTRHRRSTNLRAVASRCHGPYPKSLPWVRYTPRALPNDWRRRRRTPGAAEPTVITVAEEIAPPITAENTCLPGRDQALSGGLNAIPRASPSTDPRTVTQWRSRPGDVKARRAGCCVLPLAVPPSSSRYQPR